MVAGTGSPGATTKKMTTVRSLGALGKAKEEENEDENEEEDGEMGTPKRKRSSPGRRAATKKTKKDDEDKEEEKEDDEVNLTPKTSRNAKGSASPGTAKRASFASVEEYDAFLLSEKQGRFVRVGSWTGMSKGILHRCNDGECAREWKPSPAQALADDYYCPSCVLHHRNNEDRFEDPRLEWTRHVPNTLYVFSIIDPKTKKKLIKFGRTQHLDAWKRYPAKERKDYKMELLLSLRGKLETTTKIENWWKSQADEHGYFTRFSDPNFHGKDECLELSPEVLEEMVAHSKEVLAAE